MQKHSMRFLVPQFIEVEDQVIGPLTLKQGIYILGGVGLSVALFVRFGFLVALLFGAPVLGIAFMLAFVKIHGRPFSHTLSSAFFFATKNKLYLWKKTPKKMELEKKKEEEKETTANPTPVEMTQSKLKKLAWTLDTNNMFEKDKK